MRVCPELAPGLMHRNKARRIRATWAEQRTEIDVDVNVN
jgi:hypothetical protein